MQYAATGFRGVSPLSQRLTRRGVGFIALTYTLGGDTTVSVDVDKPLLCDQDCCCCEALKR